MLFQMLFSSAFFNSRLILYCKLLILSLSRLFTNSFVAIMTLLIGTGYEYDGNVACVLQVRRVEVVTK